MNAISRRHFAAGLGGITIAHNVRTKEDVAAVLTTAERAGGKIVKPAQDVFWGGHSGYFSNGSQSLHNLARIVDGQPPTR